MAKTLLYQVLTQNNAALTIAVDSHFWRTPVWPELSGVHFNIVQGKSADWGVSNLFIIFLYSHPMRFIRHFQLERTSLPSCQKSCCLLMSTAWPGYCWIEGYDSWVYLL